MQSAMLTLHGYFPEDSHRRSLRKGRSDDEPFDQILATEAQDDTESDGGGSIAFTSSRKPSRVTKRGKNGGRSRAHAYAETTEDPSYAYIKQYHNIHLQQHLYDSDGGLADCWGAFRKALIGCFTSQRSLERDMVRADQRYREMKRRQEVERQKEVGRKMELTDQKMHRRLDAVVRKYELESKLKEQRERQLRNLKEMVLQEWAKTVGPQTWRLTEEEVKELERLQKEEGDLHLKIQRLREKEAMSETCTCTDSVDMSEDERGQQLQRELWREKERQSHLKQQQLETRVCETLSESHKRVCATAVNSRLSSLLTDEEMELMQRLQNQQDSLLLRIKALEDRQARSKTHELSLKGTGCQTLPGSSWTSQQNKGSIGMAQHREVEAQADRIAQLEKEREMERHREQERLRAMDRLTDFERYQERMREAERRRESELDEEWSRQMERLKEMKKEEMMIKEEKEWLERQGALKEKNRMETEREREVRKEIDKKHYQLEMQLKSVERNFAKERDMDQKRYDERVRELENKCQQDLEANMLEMEHKMEKEREMSQKREEELLRHIEHQQNAKKDTLKHAEKKVEKERQRHLDMEQEPEQTKVECQNMGSESERKTETGREKQEMEEQLKKMKQHFEKEREMERQRHENRCREIEEKNQQEWEERTRELEAKREVAQQQELELLKLRENQKKAKEEEWVKELKQTEKGREGTKTSVEETHRNTKLQKERDEAKIWMAEIKINVQTKEKVSEDESENDGKIAEVEERKPGTEGLDWLGELRQKGDKNKDISQHKEQLSLEDTSKDAYLQGTSIRKHKQRGADAEQKHEELADDRLGGGKDKWSDIRRKHQKSREESREALLKQFHQGQQTETNNCTVARRKGRHGARETDAEEQTVTEEKKQERKDVVNLQNEGLDSLGGLQQKVRKGRRAGLQEEAHITIVEQNSNNNNSLTPCSAHFTVSRTEAMLKESHQREITQPGRVKRPRGVYQQKVRPTGNQRPKPLHSKSHIRSKLDQTPDPMPDPTPLLQRESNDTPDGISTLKENHQRENACQKEKKQRHQPKRQTQDGGKQREREVQLETEATGDRSECPNITDKEAITHLVRVKRPRGVYLPVVQPTGNQRPKPLLSKSHIRSNVEQTPDPQPDKTLNGISMDTVSSEIKLAAEREESLLQEQTREQQERAKERLRIERERETEMKEITAVAERTYTKTDLENETEREEARTSEMKETDDETQVCSDLLQSSVSPPSLADDVDDVEELAGSVLQSSAERSAKDAMPGATDPQDAEAEAESGTKKDKSVRRRVFGWVNKRVKNYYQRKIERTHARESEEGDDDYYPWYFDSPISRAEREQQKREELSKAESRRQKMEDSWLKWQAKKAEKKDKARDKEQEKMEKRMARHQEREQKLNDIEEHAYQRHLEKTNQ